MNNLPAELLYQIASDSSEVYWGLATAYPRFARSLTPGRRADFAVKFGHDYHVVRYDGPDYGTMWTRNGVLHRIDGPALSDGITSSWYINGVVTMEFKVNVEETTYFSRGLIHSDRGPAVVSDTKKMWYRHGVIHRDGGPAIIKRKFKSGVFYTVEYWYKRGFLHRKGGPAVVKPYGANKWIQWDQLHRKDGPAIEHPNKTYSYYIRDWRSRIDGPATVDFDKISWRWNDRPHRMDGPAKVRGTDILSWWYGMAGLPADVSCEWWIDGLHVPTPSGEIVLTNSLGQTTILR